MHPRPLAILALVSFPVLVAGPPKATAARACTACHATAPGNLQGYLEDVSANTHSFRMKLDGATEVLRYDKDTLKVLSDEKADTPEAALEGLKRGRAVRVEFTETDGVKTATLLSAKPPIKLAQNDLVSTEELQRLVALGPEQGKYFLFDARPSARFHEGSIPTAVNLPFPTFDEQVERLPSDKGALVIFFCHGKTCNMSPSAFAKARKMGYTNAKVYAEGMPGWYAKSYGVVSPASFKDAFLDKDVPAILLDVRPVEEVRNGFIRGTVTVAPSGLKNLLAKSFPAPSLKPPILVVDGQGGEAAKAAAMELVRSDYRGVNVLTGGFSAWKAASLPVDTGTPKTKVAYAPRLRPGSIPSTEFHRIASLPPEARKEILILDVRSRDEAMLGMIKGALNLPHDEIETRLTEIPKDRRVLIHCGTGTQAEAAYNVLKEKGYNAAYLNAEITIIDTGEFVIE